MSLMHKIDCVCVCTKAFCSVQINTIFFFFKQKTAYEMRISDWSSDVCSSDLVEIRGGRRIGAAVRVDRVLAGDWTRLGVVAAERQIGRASCRERVCQYV